MVELTKRAKPEGGDLRSSLALHGIPLLTGLSFTVQWIYTGSAVDICQVMLACIFCRRIFGSHIILLLLSCTLSVTEEPGRAA